MKVCPMGDDISPSKANAAAMEGSRTRNAD
jgi:hypothetical protein